MDLGLNLAHLHLLLNHFPTVGTIVATGLFALALLKKSDDLKRASLAAFFTLAIVALPAYMTGYSAQAAIKGRPDISTAMIDSHQVAALVALIVLEITGAVAWFGLWQYRRHARPKAWVMPATLVLSLLSVALMARAANIGGGVVHEEARAAQEFTPPAFEPDMLKSAAVTRMVSDYPWVWPVAEILHFLGLTVLFGVVLSVNLRLLGVMKHVALVDVYKLLPLAMWAFVIQGITGMVFFIAQAFQYIDNVAFHWKILLMLVAAANVLYLTIFDDFWELGPEDDAPVLAKVASASQVALWLGVLYFGRMLPYLGNAF
jgi:uncharacterized membrane protein